MVRRLVDMVASCVALLLAMPLFLLTAAAIWTTDRGPLLFAQVRAGRFARPFKVLKFRSMRVNNLSVVAVGKVDPSNPLVTAVGRFLRRYKIDELPQLVNVLSGDMSLIGPRPTIFEQVNEYTSFQRRRLQVRPGLTGWAQVNGGIEISWPERILLDVWYVDHRCIALDIKIIFRTLGTIFLGDAPNHKAIQEATEYATKYCEGEGSSTCRKLSPPLATFPTVLSE